MKIFIVAGQDRSLINFRAPLIRALISAGCEVVACAPLEHAEIPLQLRALGAKFRVLKLSRTGLNPMADVRSIFAMRRILREERPDAILACTIKAVIYGSIAACCERIPRRFALITGLGSVVFGSESVRSWVRWIAIQLYRLALPRYDIIFAQNPDIVTFLANNSIFPKKRIIVVKGSGVALDYYPHIQIQKGPPRFLLLSRLLKDKGIIEYIEAARTIKRRFPNALFRLVGDPDDNPSGISLERAEQWHAEGIVEYYRHQSDVRPFLVDCSVCVLPSYHEGVPRSVLEAMATGRPIITTNAIGCKETVHPNRETGSYLQGALGVLRGENGFLVPVKSVDALAAAMEFLVNNPDIVENMGQQSRRLAEEEFDVNKVNKVMLAGMGIRPK